MDCRIPFSAVYKTVSFKDGGQVYLPAVAITASILEVERNTSAQDRFNLSHQRSVNKVRAAPVAHRPLSDTREEAGVCLTPRKFLEANLFQTG